MDTVELGPSGFVIDRTHGLDASRKDRSLCRASRHVRSSFRLKKEKYAYRRFGKKSEYPLLFLQHFTGTLDNRDPLVTDPLARNHDVILFESAGVGRSSGTVPRTVEGMALHALEFLDALSLGTVDVLGFSLGGMVAQAMALQRPSIVRKMILVAKAPGGGEDIMHLQKPSLARHIGNPNLKGYEFCRRSSLSQPSRVSRRGRPSLLA